MQCMHMHMHFKIILMITVIPSPLRWNRTTKQCDGVTNRLTGELFLMYIYLCYVKFMDIRNHNVSFDKNGDPTGAYEIS